jgi:hypothetical protein
MTSDIADREKGRKRDKESGREGERETRRIHGGGLSSKSQAPNSKGIPHHF